jgi:hypothetical protein
VVQQRFSSSTSGLIAAWRILTIGLYWRAGKREDVGEWFGRHGWEVTVATTPDGWPVTTATPAEQVQDTTPQDLFVAAERT